MVRPVRCEAVFVQASTPSSHTSSLGGGAAEEAGAALEPGAAEEAGAALELGAAAPVGAAAAPVGAAAAEPVATGGTSGAALGRSTSALASRANVTGVTSAIMTQAAAQLARRNDRSIERQINSEIRGCKCGHR
jgi:hypothetical protein